MQKLTNLTISCAANFSKILWISEEHTSAFKFLRSWSISSADVIGKLGNDSCKMHNTSLSYSLWSERCECPIKSEILIIFLVYILSFISYKILKNYI